MNSKYITTTVCLPLTLRVIGSIFYANFLAIGTIRQNY